VRDEDKHREDEPDDIPNVLQPHFPKWPAPIDSIEFESEPIEHPTPIVDDLLHAGSRLIFGGGSKTFKTWAMCDMAISIAQGAQWWGFTTHKHKVLYVNFELQRYFMQKRLCAIRKAKGIKNESGQLMIWNLRDEDIELIFFVESVIRLIRNNGITVVFIDPFYKLLGDRDERVSSEINQLINAVKNISRLTNATIIFAAHFTKGNQAGKESMDRISGGGSMSRDPDNLITLTDAEEDHTYSVEFTIRDYRQIEKFGVRWQYPLLERDDQIDASKLRKVPNHRPVQCDPEKMFDLIARNDDELNVTQAAQKAVEEFGWSERTAKTKIGFLREAKRLRVSITSGNLNVVDKKR
jgi:hypothetical protein